MKNKSMSSFIDFFAKTFAGIALISFVCSAATAAEQRKIELVTVEGEFIRIKTNAEVEALPKDFSIESPPRIALDFLEYGSSVPRGVMSIDKGNVVTANVVGVDGRTRVIIGLKRSLPYKIFKKDDEIIIGFQNQTNEPVTRSASPQLEEIKSIGEMDFRRVGDNYGRVIFELPSNQVGVDIKQQGQSLVLELKNVVLAEGMRRRLDVSDFGTPVQTITSSQHASGVKIEIQVKGSWEHSAYQSDAKLAIDVKDVKTDSLKLGGGNGYTGEKLSLNFQNIDVRSLLQVIADFTNFNVVTSDTVSGSLTLRLKDVPWDQALEIIMQSKGLDKRQNGNVIWIAPKDEINAREKAELEAKMSMEGLEAVRTQGFQLNYAKAADIAAQINASANAGGVNASAGAAKMLSARGSVIAESRTNQLFITDIPSKLDQIKSFIAKLDIPVRQVLIEARIVEADDKFGKSLGVKLGGADLRGIRGGDAGYGIGAGNRIAVGGSYDAITATTGAFSADGLNTASSNFVNLPASGFGGYAPASFALSLFNASANRFLNLEISALEADSRGKVVSSPRLVTADQVKAIIEQGVEFPYQTTAPNGGTTISFKKAALKLEVTPQITPEGSIILDVEVNKDSPGEILLGARAINTKRVQTQVLVENGGTVVIGGIFESTDTDGETKIPLLGDLPIMGNLFKTKSKTSNKSEMLVFITPKVIVGK